jgi:hypothetical protein
MNQLPLAARVARAVDYVKSGNAYAMIVAPAELERARAMVGDAPVIVTTPGDSMTRFLIYWEKKLRQQYGGRRRRRR